MIIFSKHSGYIAGRRIYPKKDGPDNKGLNQAALESAQLSREALEWFKGEYANTAGDRKAATERAAAVSDAQLKAMDFATQQAQDLDTRNKTVFQPMEDKLVADAQNYDTGGRRAQAAAEARSDVEQGFSSAQDGLNRTLMRMGVTPGGGRSAALMQDAALTKAKSLAGMTNSAVKGVEAQGYARKMDAVGLGKGIVGSQATQQQIATQTGNASVGNQNASLGAATSGAGMMQTGFSQALQGMGQSGSLYGQAAALDQQASQSKSELIGSLGGVAGMFLAGSDEDIKKDTKKPANTARMLKETVATPNKEAWQYDPAKGGPDQGGMKHDGPMAGDVQKTMGNDVAPGGKVIDLISMNGKLLGAVQELDKQLKGTNQRLKRMESKAAA